MEMIIVLSGMKVNFIYQALCCVTDLFIFAVYSNVNSYIVK